LSFVSSLSSSTGSSSGTLAGPTLTTPAPTLPTLPIARLTSELLANLGLQEGAFGPDDPKRESRLHGLATMRKGWAQMIDGALQTLRAKLR